MKPSNGITTLEIILIVVRAFGQVYRLYRLIKQEKDLRIVQNLEPVTIFFDTENLVSKFH
jgi:hypothetical protein